MHCTNNNVNVYNVSIYLFIFNLGSNLYAACGHKFAYHMYNKGKLKKKFFSWDYSFCASFTQLNCWLHFG